MRFASRRVVALLAAAFSLACGGGSSRGLSVAGAVYDASTASSPPVLGATVTLRGAADDGAIATATTRGDGSFVIEGVPASTEVYVDVAKTGYASFNYPVFSTASGVSGMSLWIALAANVQTSWDLIAWSDPPQGGDYSTRGWLAIDIYDGSGQEVPGVTVAAAPADLTVLYNNGLDVFLPSGPTASLSSHSAASLVGGYGSVAGVHTLTLTDGTKTKTLELPLVKGEMTYASVYPW
jgi:hypothetical protein